jgi:hypothetical protein
MKHSTSLSYFLSLLTATIVMTVFLGGCSATLPAGATGAMSTIQQKTLNLATKRSLDSAGIDAKFLGEKTYYLIFSDIGQTDIGKQHVCGTVRSEIIERGGRFVDDQKDADCILVCTVHIAGIDTRPGSIIVVRWIDTRAEVDVSVNKKCGQIMDTKRGSESAKFNQVWIFGWPSESLK